MTLHMRGLQVATWVTERTLLKIHPNNMCCWIYILCQMKIFKNHLLHAMLLSPPLPVPLWHDKYHLYIALLHLSTCHFPKGAEKKDETNAAISSFDSQRLGAMQKEVDADEHYCFSLCIYNKGILSLVVPVVQHVYHLWDSSKKESFITARTAGKFHSRLLCLALAYRWAPGPPKWPWWLLIIRCTQQMCRPWSYWQLSGENLQLPNVCSR